MIEKIKLVIKQVDGSWCLDKEDEICLIMCVDVVEERFGIGPEAGAITVSVTDGFPPDNRKWIHVIRNPANEQMMFVSVEDGRWKQMYVFMNARWTLDELFPDSQEFWFTVEVYDEDND